MAFRGKLAWSAAALALAVSHGLAGELRPPPPGMTPTVVSSDPFFTMEEIEASFSGEPAERREEKLYDPLPLSMADMGAYERIAMDPYAGTYDDLPLEEKRELYSRQFSLLHGRLPNLPPFPDRYGDDGYSRDNAGDGSGHPRAVGSGHDPLPRRMAEMDRLMRIAMEPYAEVYDDLPLSEKAELYARQFEFMNNRPPHFPTDVAATLDDDKAKPAREKPSKRNREKKSRRNRDRGRDTARDDDEAQAEDPAGDLPPGWFTGPPPYDTFPGRVADMSSHDRIAMGPFLDEYEAIPLAERVAVYARQFSFMHDREPRFHPALLAEIRGAPYAASEFEAMPVSAPSPTANVPAPAAQPGPSLRPPPPSFDGFPRRMADMTREERLAMEPYRERYDGLPITERAMLYARQFQRLHGRFPKFPPEVMAEIGLSQYTSVDLEAMGLKEVVESLRAQAVPEYDDLPLTFAEMGVEARNALEHYRYGYDRFSLSEKARIYATQFRSIYGRPPSFRPDVAERIERSRLGMPEEPQFVPGASDEMEAATLPASKPPRAGRYDALPRRIGEMTPYDRIAMEPYWNTYDTLPLAEKARLYATQFEFMQGRPPVFHPSVEEAIREDEANPRPNRRDGQIYKAASTRRGRLGIHPEALPGPWNPTAGQETVTGKDSGVVLHPDGTVYEERDYRMDSFRRGWSVLDTPDSP